MPVTRISRRTMLRGTGTATIGFPLLEEMISTPAHAAPAAAPVRAFNVFFGLGIPAPLQAEGFDGVLEPLKPLARKLLIMRNVDQVRATRRASTRTTTAPPVPLRPSLLTVRPGREAVRSNRWSDVAIIRKGSPGAWSPR